MMMIFFVLGLRNSHVYLINFSVYFWGVGVGGLRDPVDYDFESWNMT